MIPSSQIEYNDSHQLGAGAQGIAYLALWKSKEVVFKKLTVRQADNDKKEFLCELEVWRYVRFIYSISYSSHY